MPNARISSRMIHHPRPMLKKLPSLVVKPGQCLLFVVSTILCERCPEVTECLDQKKWPRAGGRRGQSKLRVDVNRGGRLLDNDKPQ
jgi:hypothetical protein